MHTVRVMRITWVWMPAADTASMDITTSPIEARQPALWRSRVRGWAAAQRPASGSPRRAGRPWPFVAVPAAAAADDTPVIDGDEFLRRLREAGL